MKKTAVVGIILLTVMNITGCGNTVAQTEVKTEMTEVKEAFTLDNAIEKALSDAGMASTDIHSMKASTGKNNAADVYIVQFQTEDTKYEYQFNTDTGIMCAKSHEKLTIEAQDDVQLTEQTTVDDSQPVSDKKPKTQQPNTENQKSAQITVDAAKNAAVADAGLSIASVTFTKAQLDYDDGIQVYDIEFYTSTHEYDYEINSATGAVYSKDVEVHSVAYQQPAAGNSSTQKGDIGKEAAKDIALRHAGVSASEAAFTKAEYDYDDGQAVYEIEFYRGGKEYDFEISAATGAILGYEVN